MNKILISLPGYPQTPKELLKALEKCKKDYDFAYYNFLMNFVMPRVLADKVLRALR